MGIKIEELEERLNTAEEHIVHLENTLGLLQSKLKLRFGITDQIEEIDGILYDLQAKQYPEVGRE